ncbi:hypothetical protein ACFXPT_39575 [Streptomyces goshikiensis]|uniref:hypothetical protein n=1 Tax=Streptomyces goshikiensis TaxID=1942 RepID=UPI0036A96AA2
MALGQYHYRLQYENNSIFVYQLYPNFDQSTPMEDVMAIVNDIENSYAKNTKKIAVDFAYVSVISKDTVDQFARLYNTLGREACFPSPRLRLCGVKPDLREILKVSSWTCGLVSYSDISSVVASFGTL